jgi:mutual gliding-motility protein MglA
MVQINFAQKQVNAKIVYYGPGMSGKTTNLEVVHQRAPTANRGDLTSISTDGDRTLFFDFMPLDLGTVAGMRTCFQIYTVPGQVYYNSTRKLVLQGVDGVVFVADSSGSMVQENLESLKNLEQNLNEYGKTLASLPHVIQYNKRDLPDAMSVEELNRLLNAHNAPCFEAVANTGQGVFPTLKALAARVLETIHTGSRGGAPAPAPTAAPLPSAFPSQPQVAAASAQKSLHQTGYTPVAPGTGGPAPIPMQRPTAPAPVPAYAQGPQMAAPRAPQASAYPPQAPAMPQMAPAPIPMQQMPSGPPLAPNFRAPAAPQAPAGAGKTAYLQMMRNDSARMPAPMQAPMPSRAAPVAPARPAPRPQSARPAPARSAAPRISTGPEPKKKSFTTLILVVAALVAGAVMAVAVFS